MSGSDIGMEWVMIGQVEGSGSDTGMERVMIDQVEVSGNDTGMWCNIAMSPCNRNIPL